MRRSAAAVLLTLILGACGSPGTQGDEGAREVVLAAVSATENAGSARMSGEMSITVPEGSDIPGFSGFDMSIEGVSDLDGRRGHITMRFEGLPETPGLEDFGDIEMIVDGSDVYMKSPILSPDGSKPWVRMDLSDVVGAGSQFSQADPTQALQYLQGVSDDVEEVGREEIRGVATTQYDATVDIAKAAEELPEQTRAQFEAALERFDVDEFPIRVWIDDQGRMRREFFEFDFSDFEGAVEGTKMTMTVDFYDFGVEFDIEIPPESQVQDGPPGQFGTSGV